jgi:diguanylate cyclase (GGDEF)-like protein
VGHQQTFTGLDCPILRNGAGDLADVAARLQRLIDREGGQMDGEGRRLVEDLLNAAADAEQTIADQAQRIRHLENLSNTDELTGLLNRRGFHNALETALANAERHDDAGVLLMCDLDQFKAVNDTYGHIAGDAVLASVARTIRQNSRRGDQAARIGGDEFAILLPNTPPQRAAHLVAKLEALLNHLVVAWQDHQIPVSASIGYECYGPKSRQRALLFLADRALYRRKHPTGLALAL